MCPESLNLALGRSSCKLHSRSYTIFLKLLKFQAGGWSPLPSPTPFWISSYYHGHPFRCTAQQQVGYKIKGMLLNISHNPTWHLHRLMHQEEHLTVSAEKSFHRVLAGAIAARPSSPPAVPGQLQQQPLRQASLSQASNVGSTDTAECC